MDTEPLTPAEIRRRFALLDELELARSATPREHAVAVGTPHGLAVVRFTAHLVPARSPNALYVLADGQVLFYDPRAPRLAALADPAVDLLELTDAADAATLLAQLAGWRPHCSGV